MDETKARVGAVVVSVAVFGLGLGAVLGVSTPSSIPGSPSLPGLHLGPQHTDSQKAEQQSTTKQLPDTARREAVNPRQADQPEVKKAPVPPASSDEQRRAGGAAGAVTSTPTPTPTPTPSAPTATSTPTSEPTTAEPDPGETSSAAPELAAGG